MRAVLFDAAGTLIEPRRPVGETYLRAARAHGGEGGDSTSVDEVFRDVLRAMPEMVFSGHAGERACALERDWWRRVVHSTFERARVGIAGAALEHCFDDLFAHYARPDAWRLLPGAAEILAELRARGLRTAVVSNFDRRLPPILDGLGVGALLDAVILPSDAAAAKPDPRIFRFALSRLDVEADDALYVGDDAEQDVAGAESAGIAAFDVTSAPGLGAVLDRIGRPT